MTLKKWTEPARRRTILVRNAGSLSMLRPPPPRRVVPRCLAFPEVHFAFRGEGQLYAGLARSRGGLFLPVIGNHVSGGGRVCLGSATPASLDPEDFVDAFWNSVFHVFDEQVGDFQRWQGSGDPDDATREDMEIGELGASDGGFVAVTIPAAVVFERAIITRRRTRVVAEETPEVETPEVEEPSPPPRRRSAMLRTFRDEEPWRVAWRRRRIR